MDEQPARLRDLARVFLKIGAMSYGGPAIMGIMQNEIQERRRWLGKERFVEGLSIVNMLPGPSATQLAIFIGHTKAGLAGGIVAGICFIIPAFAIMLLLASAYGAFGALPAMRNAFYGIGPVVVGIFAVAIYRLARGTIKDLQQIPIAIAAVGLMLFSPVGLAVTLLATGCVGMALFHSWRTGSAALLLLVLAVAGAYAAEGFVVGAALPIADPGPRSTAAMATLWDVGAFFFKVGTFTFGGGLSLPARSSCRRS
jgi:chromate transporter